MAASSRKLSRKKARVSRKHRRTDKGDARRALLEALGPKLAGEFEHNVPDVIDTVAELVAGGHTTAEAGASALARLNDLADATERGEITTDEGCALIVVQAIADREGREPD